ncbi:MAG TPA: hypothetical protein VK921_11760 [Anditalea sp.]|nr:hypothetical protein [Anditalea sp.]
MKLQTHSLLRVLLVINLILISCSQKSYISTEIDHIGLGYELINQFPSSKKGLYYKTYGGNEGRLEGWLSYRVINDGNRKENYILELERFVDFDTIFTPVQREELDKQFQNLESIKLDENRLKDKRLRKTMDKSNLEPGILDAVSFPVIQPSKDGILFAFMYYAWSSFDGHNGSSEIYIYKRDGEKWERFAIVFVSIT